MQHGAKFMKGCGRFFRGADDDLRIRPIFNAGENDVAARRALHPADLPQLRSFGTASAYAAAVIFAIYISGTDVMALYAHPARLWMVVPLMLLWLSRVWLLASRGELNEDPVIFAMTDRMSLIIGLAVAIVVFTAI